MNNKPVIDVYEYEIKDGRKMVLLPVFSDTFLTYLETVQTEWEKDLMRTAWTKRNGSLTRYRNADELIAYYYRKDDKLYEIEPFWQVRGGWHYQAREVGTHEWEFVSKRLKTIRQHLGII